MGERGFSSAAVRTDFRTTSLPAGNAAPTAQVSISPAAAPTIRAVRPRLCSLHTNRQPFPTDGRPVCQFSLTAHAARTAEARAGRAHRARGRRRADDAALQKRRQNADGRRRKPHAACYPQHNLRQSEKEGRRKSKMLFRRPLFLCADSRPYCASAAPSALHAASAASSGASLQMTGSQTSAAPSSRQRSSQFRIHSPSPQP